MNGGSAHALTTTVESPLAADGSLSAAVVPSEVGLCIFFGCVSTDRHWHGGFPGGYDNPADLTGAPIPFTTEPEPGVRDYNGALLPSEVDR